jgi:Zn-finger nucleic acid-binding protein
MWLERGELEKIAARLREVERDDDDRYERRPDAYRRDDDDDRRYARPPEPYRRHDDDARRYSDDPRYHTKKKKWTDLFEIFD